MTLEPLLAAGPAVYLHATAAIVAFGLGLAQFAGPKGTMPHRLMGWTWVILMAGVALSSFLIHELRLWGEWSPIHLLSIFTLAMLVLAVWRARRGDHKGHRNTMIGLFLGALIIAGLFAFLPGRIMHAVVFGS